MTIWITGRDFPRIMNLNWFRISALALACGALGLGACTRVPRFVNEYKIDVQQGNVVTQEMVSQLRPGQTKDQVRYILGTPLLMDVFHANRWDYIYRLHKGSTGETDEQKLTLFFDGEGRLVRVTGDVAAAATTDVTTDAAVPANRMQELDLGSVDPETAAPPQNENERGFFGRMFEKIGF